MLDAKRAFDFPSVNQIPMLFCGKKFKMVDYFSRHKCISETPALSFIQHDESAFTVDVDESSLIEGITVANDLDSPNCDLIVVANQVPKMPGDSLSNYSFNTVVATDHLGNTSTYSLVDNEQLITLVDDHVSNSYSNSAEVVYEQFLQ